MDSSLYLTLQEHFGEFLLFLAIMSKFCLFKFPFNKLNESCHFCHQYSISINSYPMFTFFFKQQKFSRDWTLNRVMMRMSIRK